MAHLFALSNPLPGGIGLYSYPATIASESSACYTSDTMATHKLVIAPSILAADFARLGEEIQAVEASGADRIHVDVMDGHFVPNISMGPGVVKSIRPRTALPFDVHLMITDPDRYVEAFARAGANVLIPHIEVCPDALHTIEGIGALGCQAGMAISPDTPVDALRAVAPHVDMVIVMSVYPGFGGQEFIEGSLDRIRAIRSLLDSCNPEASIAVDGGIEISNVERAVAAGADNVVAGSSIFRTDIPPGEAVIQMRRAAEAAAG